MNRHVLKWTTALGLILGAVMVPLLARSAIAPARAAVARPAQGTVEGTVMQQGGGPVAGAVVRLPTTTNMTISGADGSFTLGGLQDGVQVTLTAWQAGYIVGSARVTPPQNGAIISMRLHYTEDNPDYQWFSSNDPGHSMSCMHCMVAYPQWQPNAHANSATSPRFFSVYNGTDLTGMADVAPGYKDDFPGTAGNCAACHSPAAVIPGIATPITGTTTITGSISADMNAVSGVEAEGSFCEFCHKIGEVYLDPATGLPYDDKPGVLSTRMYRSPPGHVLWFGPFDDVARRVTYLELEKKSQFCAPCHQFSFGGTPIYESFREWLESPYPALGIECQTCHMKPTGVDYFVFPEKGGFTRDPSLIASHLQPGASDVELLQNTVNMAVSAEQTDGSLQVTVVVTNTDAGHHVPTDHPGRHMILLVSATDAQGQAIPQQGGPTVPDWGGDRADLSGKAFAKVLQDDASGESPVVGYWKPVTIISDNRIAAMESDTSVYTFTAPPEGGRVTVDVKLIFRRLYQDLMDAKDWDTPDIVMEEVQVELVTTPATATPTPTSAPTSTPTPTSTPAPTSTPTPTATPVRLYLPLTVNVGASGKG